MQLILLLKYPTKGIVHLADYPSGHILFRPSRLTVKKRRLGFVRHDPYWLVVARRFSFLLLILLNQQQLVLTVDSTTVDANLNLKYHIAKAKTVGSGQFN